MEKYPDTEPCELTAEPGGTTQSVFGTLGTDSQLIAGSRVCAKCDGRQLRRLVRIRPQIPWQRDIYSYDHTYASALS